MSDFIPRLPEINSADITCRDDLVAWARTTDQALTELIALSWSSDPFTTGTPETREKAQWIAGLTDRFGIDTGTSHQREVHYDLVVNNAVRPDGRQYIGVRRDESLLTDAISCAKNLGLFPRQAFPDKRTVTAADSSASRAQSEIVWEAEPPGLWLPSLWLPGVKPWSFDVELPTRLQMQPVIIEVVAEKDSVVNDLLPPVHRFGLRLVVATGFTSEGLAVDILDRAIADGRPVVVFTISDADAAGESMANVTARHLEAYWQQARRNGEEPPPIYLKRVALDIDQVALIEQNIGRKIPRSPDVSGREKGRVELEALSAFAPGWLASELEGYLRWLTVEPDFTETDEAIIDERERLADLLAEPLAEINRIEEEAKRLLERKYVQTVKARFDALRDRLEGPVAEAKRIIEEFELDVPDPEVDPAGLDAIDWLLSTDRVSGRGPDGYVEQLNAYRRHEPEQRRRPPLVVGPRPPCKCGCGASMDGLDPRQKYLTVQHEKRDSGRRMRARAKAKRERGT